MYPYKGTFTYTSPDAAGGAGGMHRTQFSTWGRPRRCEAAMATLSVLRPHADISSIQGLGNILKVIFNGFDWPDFLAPSVCLLM